MKEQKPGEPEGEDLFRIYVATHLKGSSDVTPTEKEVDEAIEKINEGIENIIRYFQDLTYIEDREKIRSNTSKLN